MMRLAFRALWRTCMRGRTKPRHPISSPGQDVQADQRVPPNQALSLNSARGNY
jgi:hypothetical protein